MGEVDSPSSELSAMGEVDSPTSELSAMASSKEYGYVTYGSLKTEYFLSR
jgi:hypothetical protein